MSEPTDGEDGPEDPADGDDPNRSDDDRRLRRGEVGLQPLADLLDRLRRLAERESVETETSASVSSVDEFLKRHQAEERQRRREAAGESADTAVDTTTAEGYHVQTQYEGDEFVVVADLLGASIEDLRAGLVPDRNELVVRRDDETVVRVGLPWLEAEPTRARYNNGVLEIRLRQVT